MTQSTGPAPAQGKLEISRIPIDIMYNYGIVQLNITVLALRPEATLQNPDYNVYSQEDLVLPRQAFYSYIELHEAIYQNSSCGYLRQQFFRIALSEEYKSGVFLTSERLLTLDFTQTICFVLIRYTKHQTQLLRAKIPREEYLLLDQLMRFKRTVIYPARKFPKYIQKASAMLSNYPLTVFDAYARLRRLSHADENTLWKVAYYYQAGLIDMRDIMQMDELGLDHWVKAEHYQDTQPMETVFIDVPEFLVAQVQRLVARKMLRGLIPDDEY